MSGVGLFLMFVGAMMIAARVFLRGERRPPISPNQENRRSRPASSARWSKRKRG